MSNDNTSSSNDSNNEDEPDSAKKDTQEEPVEADVLKDKLDTFKRVAIYALFLFVKICCYIFINANIIFFFTYLFDRIYYKKFTFGNSKIKKNMVQEFNQYLDEKFPSNRKKYPYANGPLNVIKDNKLLTCPVDFKKYAGTGTSGTSGKSASFTCGEGDGKVPCDGAAAAAAPGATLASKAAKIGAAAGAAAGAAGAAGPAGPAMAGVPLMVGGGEQKGGASNKIFTNINNLSTKIIEGIKPVNNVKKTIDELYKKKEILKSEEVSGDGDLGDGDIGDIETDSTSECKKDKFSTVDLTTCESVKCSDKPLPIPYGWSGTDGFLGDYMRIRIACMGRTQITINNKIKNTIKSFNNLLPAFCYCSENETKFLNGEDSTPKFFEGLEKNQVFREEPEKIEINCIVRNELYNGIYMVFGLFISIFYLIYWDLYVNITLFINHIILFFEIKKSPESHIKTKYKRTLQFFILMMTPFIFITNRIIAFLIMVQITYKLWVQPLFEKKNKKRLSRILIENKTIIAFMFVFSYLLLLYTIELPPNYELPVKIIPTLVLTIIVIIKIIQALYRIIKNFTFSPTTCKKS